MTLAKKIQTNMRINNVDYNVKIDMEFMNGHTRRGYLSWGTLSENCVLVRSGKGYLYYRFDFSEFESEGIDQDDPQFDIARLLFELAIKEALELIYEASIDYNVETAKFEVYIPRKVRNWFLPDERKEKLLRDLEGTPVDITLYNPTEELYDDFYEHPIFIKETFSLHIIKNIRRKQK